MASKGVSGRFRVKGPTIVTTPASHGFSSGEKINLNGKHHIITRIISRTQFEVRRTFWQWVKDLWNKLLGRKW